MLQGYVGVLLETRKSKFCSRKKGSPTKGDSNLTWTAGWEVPSDNKLLDEGVLRC